MTKGIERFKYGLAMLVASFSFQAHAGLMDYAPGPVIQDIRTSFNADKSRLVVESPRKLSYTYFFLKSPNRLVIDVDSASGFQGTPLIDKGSPLIQSIRMSSKSNGSYRIVADLTRPVSLGDHFDLAPTGGSGFRAVFDLRPAGNISQKTIIAQDRVQKSKESTYTHAQRRNIEIVVDPGHGGKDPGAIGKHSQEKTVVLQIATRLVKEINKTPGLSARLTRNDDRYLALRERSQFGRRHHADLFVSIHADAARSQSPSGPSVYILSDKGATSELARWLAKRENEDPLSGGGDSLDLSTQDGDLAKVLLDLSMSGARSVSRQAAEQVLRSLKTVAEPHKPQVEKAAFMVLKSPDVPSMLIETGFITNPKEEGRLNDPVYQDSLAEAIRDGLLTYYRVNPPHYSLFYP